MLRWLCVPCEILSCVEMASHLWLRFNCVFNSFGVEKFNNSVLFVANNIAHFFNYLLFRMNLLHWTERKETKFHIECFTEGTKPRTISLIKRKSDHRVVVFSGWKRAHTRKKKSTRQHFTMLEAVMKTFRQPPNSVKFKTVLRFLAVRYTKCKKC